MTDPAGDADSPSCGFFFYAAPPCLPTNEPISQPSIDILSLDFSDPGRSLVADIGILDLDHPVIGPYGSGPEDGTDYVVVFAVGDATVNFYAERDAAGNTVDAYLIAFVPPSLTPTATRPASVTFDIERNRVRFEAPFAVIDSAVHEVCTSCPSLGRGIELEYPFSNTAVIDRDDIFGRNTSASDSTMIGPSYIIGS